MLTGLGKDVPSHPAAAVAAAPVTPAAMADAGGGECEDARSERSEEAHIAQLILEKHEAKKRIEQLEEAVAQLTQQVQAGIGASCLHPLTPTYSRIFSATFSQTAPAHHERGSADENTTAKSPQSKQDPPPDHQQQQQQPSPPHGNSSLHLLGSCHSGAEEGRPRSATGQHVFAVNPADRDDSARRAAATLSASAARKLTNSNISSNSSNATAEVIAMWNEELVSTIEKLKRSMLKMDADAKAQFVLLNNELSVVTAENDALRRENEALKERVADDVLRQRQTNRIEMAVEKARIVARVRAAGQQRLESMEATMMETHDDLYYTQRWDAVLSPQRDVSFVFHYVSGAAFPPTGSEEFVFTVYQQVLYTTARQFGGYLAATFRGMEVFAFQDPVVALNFAKDCHEQIASLSWPERTESIPFFSTIAEYGRVLFRGPRMHSCVYACTPEVEVDPVTGRSLFFGPALRAGIEAALELSPVGEIVVNDTWARLFCRAHRMLNDSAQPVKGDVTDVRDALGPGWDVVGMPGTRGIICSILPSSLSGRRAVQANQLGTTSKFPKLASNAPTPPLPMAATGSGGGGGGAVTSTSYSSHHSATAVATAVASGTPASLTSSTASITSVASMTNALVRILKGVAVDLDGNLIPSNAGGGGTVHNSSTNKRPLLRYNYVNGSGVPGAVSLNDAAGVSYGRDSPEDAVEGKDGHWKNNAARMLELYSLKKEMENTTALYREVEKHCAALEREAMQAEDRFEISRRKLLDPSETAFVCTVDIGDDSTWRRILLVGMSAEEYQVLRSTLRSYVHVAAKHYYGFLMNGNYTDVFTYVFREVEQALAFVSEVYIQVNRTGTKYAHATRGTGQDVFLVRAGISAGSMSTIYRNTDNGVLKCTGPVIRLSGTLCDLAQNGEILAMEDVISTFYATNDNLLDTQYNIVKQRGQFLSGWDAPAVVHSILPKPFAYRRPKLMNVEPHDRVKALGCTRSAKAALMVQTRLYPRENVESLLTQQRERLERTEEAHMLSEDLYERVKESTTPRVTLKNPWVLTTRANASATHAQQVLHNRRESLPVEMDLADGAGALSSRIGALLTGDDGGSSSVPELAFMYCDAVGVSALKSELERAGGSPGLVAEVREHFNYIVQGVFLQLGGFVAKTNGKCAYITLFDSPLRALEAGVLIQQRLLDTTWPEELKSALSTLFVRDAATSTVLFNGLRAQIALHLSNQFRWKRIDSGAEVNSSSPVSATAGGVGSRTSSDLLTTFNGISGGVDVTGDALEEVVVLGRHSHGGELRVSNMLLDAVGRESLSGKLLISQLAMEVVATPTSFAITSQSTGSNGAEALGRSKSLQSRNDSVSTGSGRSRSGSNTSLRGTINAAASATAAAAATTARSRNSSTARRRSSSGGSGGGHRDTPDADHEEGSAERRRSSAFARATERTNTAGRSNAASGRRSVDFTNAASFRKRRSKLQESMVCVAAVPRRLEGRLALMLHTASPAGLDSNAAQDSTTGAGQSSGSIHSGSDKQTTLGAKARGTRGEGKRNKSVCVISSPTVASPTGDTVGTGRPRSAGQRGSLALARRDSGSGNGGSSPAVAGNHSVLSPPLALNPPSSPSSAAETPGVQPLVAGVSQISWCVEPFGATQALPRAARGSWDTDDCDEGISGHREAERIQHVAEDLLKLYNHVSFADNSHTVKLLNSQPASPVAETGSTGDNNPQTTATESNGGNDDSGDGDGKGSSPPASPSVASQPTIPRAPKGRAGNTCTDSTVTDSTVTDTAAEEGTGGVASSSPSPVASGKLRRGRGKSSTTSADSALLHYRTFMRFSKELLEYCVAAMRVGNERVKPPPIPKVEAALVVTALGSSMEVSPDLSTASPAPATLPSITAHRGSGVSAANRSGNQSATFVPRPPPASGLPGIPGSGPGGRKGAAAAVTSHHPSGGSTGKGSARNGKGLSSSGAWEPAPAVPFCPSDPYQAALNYLDETCRVFTTQTGIALGKLATIPTAPQAKPKPAFPTTRAASTNRRF